LPAGVSANPSTIPAGATEGTLIFVANADAPRGVYPVTLTATSAGGIVRDNTINLNISNAGGGNTLVKETVVTGLEVPWDLSFTPDGTLYFTERKGNFKKVVNGNVVNLSHPLNVHAETEAGLMGIDFDPSYPSEPYLYACYSYLDTSGIKNRVSRLTVGQNSLSNERILIDAIPGSTNHDGCRLIFGPDNKLYITMGDARVAANAQSVNSLSGKILRINRDGSIPSDNPFLGSQVWSYGHRNAQGLAFHSNGRLYSSEHGDASEDEVNRIIPGANYGWPYVEGRCNTTTEQIECNSRNLQEPLTVYAPTLGVSGLAFYDKDMFPEWNGNLLLASLKAGQLYRIILDSEGRAVNEEILINQDYGRLRDVEVAPDGSIYIAVSNRDNRAFPPFPKPVDDRIIRWSMQ
jgi:aldose sugar dehydrogenase